MKQTFFRAPEGPVFGGAQDKKNSPAPRNEQLDKELSSVQKEEVDDTDSAGLSPLDRASIEARYSAEAHQRIRDYRTRIDSLYLTVRKLRSSRATALATTAFQTARQYCGLILMEKGAPNPYPQSTDPTSPKIEDRADQGAILADILALEGDVSQVKALRGVAADLITELTVYLETNQPGGPIEFICQNKVVESVISGKLWLGEIKEQEADKQ